MKQLHDYQLRPMRETDLRMVREWRNAERIRQQMISDHVITEIEHRQWFEKNRYTDSFNVFEKKGEPLGVVNITQIDSKHQRAFWGFYLGKENLPKGTGTIMGYLALSLIFEELHIRKLCSEIISTNTKSVKFHEKLGFQYEGSLKKHISKEGSFRDIVLMAFMRNDWDKQKEILNKSFS